MASEAPEAATRQLAEVGIVGLTVVSGELAPGEALIDRVFTTVRAACDRAGVEPSECDSVVLAADDVADGRSITTMINATAAGAYLSDEMRVTHGGLTALGLASLRVSSGINRRSIVAAWWQPTADVGAIARTSISPRDGSRFLYPTPEPGPDEVAGACAACIVGPGDEGSDLSFEGFSFAQASYDGWLAGDREPEGALNRIGRDLADRCGPFGRDTSISGSRCESVDAWLPARDAAGLSDTEMDSPPSHHHGVADGLVVLSELSNRLKPGERGVALATGLPRFMLVEGAVVRRSHE